MGNKIAFHSTTLKISPKNIIRLRHKVEGEHVHVRVFMGTDDKYLINVGTLMVKPKEFDRLIIFFLSGSVSSDISADVSTFRGRSL